MKTAPNLGILQLALLLGVTGLAACGGDDSGTGALPLPIAGGTAASPAACTPDRYTVALSSSSALVRDEPQVMQLLVNCGGNVVVVPNVAIDWTVTSGGGTINGSTTARTTTAANGISEVTWRFGSIDPVQSIEARLNEISPSLHAALARTILAAGPNACEATGGTDLGSGRTMSADETWTKAGSPYFTQCPASVACTGEVTVTNGAVLTIEPGAAVCVNKITVTDAGRIVAAGTAVEPIHFGIRNRAGQWEGMTFKSPASTNPMSDPSVLRHTVIENPLIVDVAAHPILVEDSLIRRDPSVSRRPDGWGAGVGGCARLAIRQHRLGGIPPSRVARTVIDGLGSTPGWWDYGYGCPSLDIRVSDETPPLVVSARVINSWGPGVGITVGGAAPGVSQTLLTDCEISGSAEVGLYVDAVSTADSLPRMTSCNVFGNAQQGVVNSSGTNLQLDARGNWWGDATGPQGLRGDGTFGSVDAGDPLPAPLQLGY
jgi:hypothetical protein